MMPADQKTTDDKAMPDNEMERKAEKFERLGEKLSETEDSESE